MRLFYRRFYWLVPLWYGLSLNVTRMRRWPPLPKFYNEREIATELAWGKNWRPDPLRGLLDVVMDPRKLQHRIECGETEFGDCDDHALYWATALLQSGMADRAWLGTVWYGEGHVVCVYQRGKLAYWVDYGLPAHVVAPWGWAHLVATQRGRVAMCAGMMEVRLRPSGAPRLRVCRGRRSSSSL